jgi:SAM-dependent methyltransferase
MSGPLAVDHYGDGAWYDAEYVHIRADVPYYAGVAARAGGPLLELAAGTGRLTFPMAEAGATVHGVDLAPAMVREAWRKLERAPAEVRARLGFSVGDMRSVRLGRTFSAVVLGFNTLMHMTEDADLAGALATASEHLEVGGRFHLDLYTPFPELLARDPAGRYDPQQMIDPRTGERHVVTESNVYEPRRQLNVMRFHYQQVDRLGRPVGEERVAEVSLRVIFPRELDLWLSLAGFEVVEDWDDFDRTRPFSGRGGRRVITAVKRRAPRPLP